MANLQFNVKVILDNPGMLPELQYRTKDLSPAFEAIYQEWVAINEQKFAQAKGGEVGGAQIFEEFWAGLSGDYLKQKHPSGAPKRQRASGEYPDWLMVRTGSLMSAMTNPDALFHDIEPDSATFGTPNDPDLADIVRWQAGDGQGHRQVIFLALPDMNAIRRNLQDYLAMGGDFRAMRSAQGASAVQLEQEVHSMDAEFSHEVYE